MTMLPTDPAVVRGVLTRLADLQEGMTDVRDDIGLNNSDLGISRGLREHWDEIVLCGADLAQVARMLVKYHGQTTEAEAQAIKRTRDHAAGPGGKATPRPELQARRKAIQAREEMANDPSYLVTCVWLAAGMVAVQYANSGKGIRGLQAAVRALGCAWRPGRNWGWQFSGLSERTWTPIAKVFTDHNRPVLHVDGNGRELDGPALAEGDVETPSYLVANREGDLVALRWDRHHQLFDTCRLAVRDTAGRRWDSNRTCWTIPAGMAPSLLERLRSDGVTDADMRTLVEMAASAPAPLPAPAITRNGGKLEVRWDRGHQLFDDLMAAVKSVQGRRWDRDKTCWTVPVGSGLALYTALLQVDGADVSALTEYAQDAGKKVVAEAEAARLRAQGPKRFDLELPAGVELYDHQHEGIYHLASRSSACLGDDMGLGKTLQAILACRVVSSKGRFLIAVPASLTRNWVREAEKWWPAAQAVVLTPKACDIPAEGPVFCIVSMDTAKRKGALRDALKAQQWDVVIVDEAHRVKNPKSQRHQLIAEMDATRVWMLTGTPVQNRPLDLFGLLASSGHRMGQDFWPFARRYCNAQQTRWGWEFNGASNLRELSERLSDWMLRRTKDEVLNLPGKIRATTLVNGISNRGLNHDSIGQLMSARSELSRRKAGHALDRLEDILDGDGKVIVFSQYLGTLDALQAGLEKAGTECVRLDGSCSHDARQQAVDSFQNDSSCRVFLGQLEAAGEGITLTAGTHVLFCDLALVPAKHDQAEDRAYRIGQDKRVTCEYLLADNILDTMVWAMLAQKRDVIRRIEGGLIDSTEAAAMTAEDLLEALKTFASNAQVKDAMKRGLSQHAALELAMEAGILIGKAAEEGKHAFMVSVDQRLEACA